jgi:hypothetical protein
MSNITSIREENLKQPAHPYPNDFTLMKKALLHNIYNKAAPCISQLLQPN